MISTNGINSLTPIRILDLFSTSLFVKHAKVPSLQIEQRACNLTTLSHFQELI